MLASSSENIPKVMPVQAKNCSGSRVINVTLFLMTRKCLVLNKALTVSSITKDVTRKKIFQTLLLFYQVDTMDISAGVLVREGKIVRRGPRQVKH